MRAAGEENFNIIIGYLARCGRSEIHLELERARAPSTVTTAIQPVLKHPTKLNIDYCLARGGEIAVNAPASICPKSELKRPKWRDHFIKRLQFSNIIYCGMELQSQNLFCVFIPICIYHSAFSWFKLGPPYSIEHSECCAYTSLHVASPPPPTLLKTASASSPTANRLGTRPSGSSFVWLQGCKGWEPHFALISFLTLHTRIRCTKETEISPMAPLPKTHTEVC